MTRFAAADLACFPSCLLFHVLNRSINSSSHLARNPQSPARGFCDAHSLIISSSSAVCVSLRRKPICARSPSLLLSLCLSLPCVLSPPPCPSQPYAATPSNIVLCMWEDWAYTWMGSVSAHICSKRWMSTLKPVAGWRRANKRRRLCSSFKLFFLLSPPNRNDTSRC